MGKRPLPEPVKLSTPTVLEPPEDMPPAAREAWDKIVPTLQEIGILDGVDQMALEMMCVQWARGVDARKVVNAQGHVATGSTGQLVEHPSLATERAAAASFLKFAEHYALTPVARVRLGLAELERRSLARAMDDEIGEPKLEPA